MAIAEQLGLQHGSWNQKEIDCSAVAISDSAGLCWMLRVAILTLSIAIEIA